MNLGTIAFVVAAVLFLLAGIAPGIIPKAEIWGFLALTLGFLLGGYSLKK